MPDSQRVPISSLVFGGINQNVEETNLRTDESPDLLNVYLHPFGTASGREGMLAAAGDPVGGASGGAIEHLDYFNKANKDSAYIVAVRRGDETTASDAYLSYSALGTISFAKLPACWVQNQKSGFATGQFTDETWSGGPPATNTANNFLGDCMYCVSKENEPVIIVGDNATTTDFDINFLNDDGSGNLWVYIDAAIAAPHDAHVVWLSCTATAAHPALKGFYHLGTGLNDGADDYFPLYDADYDQVTTAGSGKEATTGTCTSWDEDFVRRWPQGAYSTTVPVPGYPPRWYDPELEGDTDWHQNAIQDWPSGIRIIGESMETRAYAWGFSLDKSRIDYSVLGAPYHFLNVDIAVANEAASTPDTYSDGGYFYANRGDGDRVIDVREYMGYLAVFKKHKTAIFSGVIGDDMTTSGAYNQPHTQKQKYSVGAVSKGSVVPVESDLYFWSTSGPRRLSAVIESNDIDQEKLSNPIRTFLKRVTKTATDKIIGWHNEDDNYICWHVPVDASTTNNACAIYYYPDIDNPLGRWTLWENDLTEMNAVVVTVAASTDQGVIYGGNTDETLYQMMTGYADGLDVTDLAYAITTADSTADSVIEQLSISSSNVVVKITAHGYSNDDIVGIGGLDKSSDYYTTLNQTLFIVETIDADTFYLKTDNTQTTYIQVAGADTENLDSDVGVCRKYTFTGTIDYSKEITGHYVTRWFTEGGIEVAKRAMYLDVVFGDDGAGDVVISKGVDYLDAWEEVTDTEGSANTEGFWDNDEWNEPNLTSYTVDDGNATGTTLDTTAVVTTAMYWDTTSRALVRYVTDDINHIIRFKISNSGRLAYNVAGMVPILYAKGTRA